MSFLDKDKPDFWRDIKPGSTLTLSDEQAIADSIERGEGVNGRDYMIESVLKIEQLDHLVEWLLFKLEDDEQDMFLSVKIVDQALDLTVFFAPVEFPPGNRFDLVERGDTWIFEDPESEDEIVYNELNFMDGIVMNVEVINEEEEEEDYDIDITYELKGQGIQYGSGTYAPEKAGIGRIMTTVIEYASSQDVENQEMMVLELGGEKNEHGGLISLFVGCKVNLSEVDVLKAQDEKPGVRKKPSLWEKALKKLS